jgi:hypothetical protein
MGVKKLYLEYCNKYDQYLQRRRVLICITICVVLLWYKLQLNRLKRCKKYDYLSERDLEREGWLNRLYHGTEANCISEPRMRKFVFHKLCGHLRSHGMLEDTICFS